MKIKVNKASGPVLDWMVAKCEDLHTGIDGFWSTAVIEQEENPFKYSTDWAQGGPIIEREDIALLPHGDGTYEAEVFLSPVRCTGPTPLIAAMRCYVASKLGEEVGIPEELA